MLLSFNDLRQFAIEARDGRKGHAEDFYFDDESWSVRYLVTEAGFLVTRKQGLVKSTLLGTPDPGRKTVPVSLTQEQLDAAQDPDAHPPVSTQEQNAIRQREFDFWPQLMLGTPGAPYTPLLAEQQLFGGPDARRDVEHVPGAPKDPHLRSMAELLDYEIVAEDGVIGSVLDFLLDPDGWKIHYIAADTGSWLPGRQIVVAPGFVSEVRWEDQRMTVARKKAMVETAPELADIDELERSDAHLAVAAYGAYAGLPI
jgi:hypothetical protein